MKKKINPIIVAIIILAILLIAIIFIYFSPEKSVKTGEESTVSTQNVENTKATIQTIENTLSSSGQINSALDEKLYLHASYYFDEMIASENVLIKEGENILKYTNGTYLTAPYNCVITSTNLPDEDSICTSSHYIEIQSTESLCMNLSVSESDINKIEIGDTVDITVTATNEKIEGYITSISEVGTYSSSGSYFTAIVTFENNGNLKIGMSASCEIIIESAENVVSVPLEAVQEDDNGKYVVVVKSNGTTENVSVETGISNDAYVEIKSGITENTTVQMQSSDNSSSGFQMNNFKGNKNSKDSGMPSGEDFPGGDRFTSSMPNNFPGNMP